MRRAAALLLLALGCDAPAEPIDSGLACTMDVISEGAIVVSARAACELELTLTERRVIDIRSEAELTIRVDEAPAVQGPTAAESAVRIVAPPGATVEIVDLGPAPDDVLAARSVVWTDDALLDDPAMITLAEVMRRVAPDGHGGPLLDAWFRRFATTAHSERLGPQRIVEQEATRQGVDPSAWDLDRLPFRLTGVHNRIDLGEETHCGEVRLTFASTDPILAPFHVIFLFRQPALPHDGAMDGRAHCVQTALLWARLSRLDPASFSAEALALIDERVRGDRLIAAETVELIISPWEWRQWYLEPTGFENRPLFQTVDAERLNRAGPDRDAFLAWVEQNAAEIDARRALIPEAFRADSARVNDGVPWIPLDLSGLPARVTDAHPRLRQHLEIVGCPACHATDAEFVHTLADRSLSPFYRAEREARAAHLFERALGAAPPPPFGPLQPDPALPP